MPAVSGLEVRNTVQAAPAKKSLGKRLWKSMRQFPMLYLGGTIVAFLVFVAVFAPVLAPHNYLTQYSSGLTASGEPTAPNSFFPWGADDLGRDELSRIIYGARVSLMVGVFSAFISFVIGTFIGLVSGYFGGFIDSVLMRLTDAILSIPFLLFTMALVAVLKPSLTNIFIAIGVQGWGIQARVTRGQVLSLKEYEYVQAERALGASTWRILFRVILPNILGPVMVITTLNIGFNMLAEAGLSVLGIGVQPPTPSWGNMIQEGLQTFTFAPWMMYAPGLALLVAVVGFNILGDGLRDILDPRNVSH
jgi:peptide/nickel transport system permease protein